MTDVAQPSSAPLLTATTTPIPTATASTAVRPAVGSHHRHHHLLHSQFSNKEKGDPNIPAHIKNLIIEQSPNRRQVYSPDKIITRTDVRFQSRDSKSVAEEKARRIQDIQKRGYSRTGSGGGDNGGNNGYGGGGGYGNIKDIYKPLGEPIVDSEQLMFESLRIDVSLINKKKHAQNRGGRETNGSGAKDGGMMLAGVMNRIAGQKSGAMAKSNNGFEILKDKIRISRERLLAVRFGSSFQELCQSREVASDVDAIISSPPSSSPPRQPVVNGENATNVSTKAPPVPAEPTHVPRVRGPVIDFSNLVFDPDKRSYYQSLLESPPTTNEANATSTIPVAVTKRPGRTEFSDPKSAVPSPFPPSLPHGINPSLLRHRMSIRPNNQSGSATEDSSISRRTSMAPASFHLSAPTTSAGRSISISIPAGGKIPFENPPSSSSAGAAGAAITAQFIFGDRPASASSAKINSPASHLNTPEIRSLETELNISRPATSDPIEQLLFAQQNFYLRQDDLNRSFSKDLTKVDAERAVTFLKKFHAFRVGAATIFVDDIANMRRRVEQQRLAEKHQQTRNHRWFDDMVNSAFHCNGTKKELSSTEVILLKKIREHVEEKLPWNQAVLISLLKMVPQSEFADTQKIFRFIKNSEAISEREYLEAIEQSGHTV